MREYFPSLAAVVLIMGFCVSPAAAVDPSLSGFLTVHFAFTPGDPGVWNYNGHSENLVLAMPPVLEISAIPGPGILSWSTPANWSTFPLDTSGLTLTTSGSGSFHATVNNGNANADVLNGTGPMEASILTRIDVTNITPSGQGPCPQCVFTVFSNFADTRYNVTIPSGAHVNVAQSNVNVQNLTVNSGGKVTGVFSAVRNNLTNHGSGNFEGTVEGNFINDAVAANGDVANAQVLILQGHLHNTGGLNVPNYFETRSATSNAASMRINGGQFHAKAAFANSGTMEFSAGTLHGPGTVTNNGAFQWTGGTIVGTSGGSAGSVVNTSNAFTISGPGSPHMFGPLTNSGTITQSGNTSSLTISGQTTLTNQAGALYNIVDDSSINSGGGTFSNAGTFRKSGGTGTSLVNSAFTNTGTIQVDTGTLKFTGGGTLNGGTLSIASGATAEIFGGGNFSMIGSNPASGGGTLKISSGHVFVANGNSGGFSNFTDGVDLLVTDNGNLEANAGGTLTLNLTGTSSVQLSGNGKVGGAGTTTNLGNFQWTSGSVVGNLTNASANFTVTGSAQSIEGGNLSNTHTITQSNNSNLQIGGGGTLTNLAGGLYDITDNSQITGLFGSVTNAGTFRKSGGSGTSLIGVPFTNTGTLAIHTGTLQVGLTLSSSSALEFKLSGTTAGQNYGKLFAVPTLAAAGTLKVSLASGFNPALGNSFDILDWSNTISGTFDTLMLPGLSGGLMWNASQLYTTGVLRVALAGDFNFNGKVDAADYVVWRKGLGTTHTQADFNVWRANFGAMAGSGSSSNATVPEPASALLLALAAAIASWTARRGLLRECRQLDHA